MKKQPSSRNLIVIGNGFDLACGEKTSVLDFVNKTINNPKNSFSEYNLNFIVFLLSYLLSDYYDKDNLCEMLHLSNSDISDWMDFEKIINHLVLDDIVFEKMQDIYEHTYNYTKQYKANTEKIIAMYFSHFRQWHHDFFGPGETYVQFLENAVKEFEHQLLHYLASIDYDRKLTAHKQLLLEELRTGYEKTSVMDFNYTSIPSNPFDHPVFHIHGSLGVGCIIGIDPFFNHPGTNDLYKTLGEKIRFTKLYKRLHYSSREGLRQPVLNKRINRVTFFGHSLGEQDYSYFQSVFDYFDLYSSDVVLIFCYTEYDPQANIKELDRTTNRVFNLINRYGETLENKDHGNNLLNKLLLEGRLLFREIDPSDVFSEEKLQKLYKQYEIA